MATISLRNPSRYPRKGYITVPWQPIETQTGIPREEVVLRDSRGTRLKAQVDRIDPNDDSLSTLVFSLEHALCPGPDDYSVVSGSAVVAGDPSEANHWFPIEACAVARQDKDGRDRVVGLINSRLRVWFNLLPTAADTMQNWYAGAATSVQLDNLEMLDAPTACCTGWRGHDPEKRGMQVADLQLLDEHNGSCGKASLFKEPYELVAQSSGPVRASITIASSPFECNCPDCVSSSGSRTRFRLYRVISLYAGVNYLVEDLYVKKMQGEKAGGVSSDSHSFTVRYFTYMNMGWDAEICRFPNIDDWFAIGWLCSPCPGYGFATNVHSTDPKCDPNGMPDRNKCFTWQTLPTLPGKSATCLHLFMQSQYGLKKGQLGHFDHQTGVAWYEIILKSIDGRLERS